ncbi:PP0621 family protein [Candidatus Pseudomonas adelgestsugas]|uniref:MYND finger n=1 Tax=Candidatus Pseudomonas adelgestsugas TaxID=1302376 RepID=A0ABX5R8D7_9PSED|nr:PP0621 family protein [Candidatus Pseudomonas adelgestsugas]QAX81769.1 hypothetical protein C3B55_00423 [Candidatus Pseudomonas adelgestsugas]
MVSLLFWIAVITAAVSFWRKFIHQAAKQQNPNKFNTVLMVRCANCGLHLPQDCALNSRQEWYCNQAHLEQGPKSIQH